MNRFVTSAVLLGAVGLASFACTGGGSAGTASSTPTPAAQQASTASKAADLRVSLDNLLGEHIFLAAKATDAALRGGTKDPEFAAYGQLLNQNGNDLGAAIGSIYGSDAQTKFDQIWSAHNGFFVDYTVGVATNDAAKKSAAVNNLKTQYIAPFASFLNGATGLPTDTLSQVLTTHVLDTAAVVDDQGSHNYDKAYSDLRAAYAQLYKIGDALTGGIVSKKASDFPGDASSSPATLRVTLNQLFQEHLYLASMATSSALRYGAADAEFKSAANALNQNGSDIAAAIGSLYGADAQAKFNQLWSAHNGFFVDYTVGVATNDAAKKSTAVDNLKNQYIKPLATFLAGATGLPDDAVANLLTSHVMDTATIVNDQGAKDWAKASGDDRTAAKQMQMIADPLASAIVQKLPAKFSA